MTNEKNENLELRAALKELLTEVHKMDKEQRKQLADKCKLEWLPQMTSQGGKNLVIALEKYSRGEN
ncbi:hypothetical protein [uncultured Enterococcus sp.]|uniref:hypothetical protein n=1 Tax=uncultured Enterococcus sp. TaxID=167972 RepID=UPI0025928AEA|nr:hypothetical protein [uncultured Enterococcus sp.]